MKKILSIALVALLAASTVFAGISGDASLSLGYNFKDGSYGFSNDNSVSVNLDLASETAESVGEGNVVAGVKATFGVKVADRHGEKGSYIWNSANKNIGIGTFFSVKEAYVKGADWKVAIKGTVDGPDFASSAIDGDYYKVVKDAFGNKFDWTYIPVSYSVDYHKAPGVTVTAKDWTIALGGNGGKLSASEDFLNYHASVFSPEFNLAEGLTAKAAAIASGIKNAKTGDVYDPSKCYDAFGASAEIAYAADAFSAKVAADFGMKKTVGTDTFKADFDVAANVAVSAFTIDGYYYYGAKLLSAKVKVDLNEFEVPVALTVTGKDLLNKKNLSAKVAASVDAVEGSVSVGYGIESKEVSVSGSASYVAEKFTASAGVTFATVLETENSNQFYVTASIESDAIVPGATLALTYADPDGANSSLNLLDGQVSPKNLGAVTASCTIAF